jgi:membrane-associated phospholipid phosphatase
VIAREPAGAVRPLAVGVRRAVVVRAMAVAAAAAIAYATLGVAVAHRPPDALWPIDTAARPLAGHATHLALIFTISCWWYVLVALGAGAIALGWARPEWRARAIFSVVTTFVAWQTSDALKNVFARPRPAYWFLHYEPTYSYSSGHAMFATVVYFLWSYFFATSSLPRGLRIALSAACGLWGCAVIWSRLALGAHWPTNLIGGVLLGITMLAIATAIAFAWPRRTRA